MAKKRARTVRDNSAVEAQAEAIGKEDCTVCYEMKGEDAGVLACNHSFCFKCIKSWSATENSCPLCKAKFSSIDRIAKKANGTTGKTKVRVTARSQAQAQGFHGFHGHHAPAFLAMMVNHLTMQFVMNHAFEGDEDDEDDDDYLPPLHHALGTAAHPITLDDEEDDEEMPNLIFHGHFQHQQAAPEVIDLTGDTDEESPAQSSSSSSDPASSLSSPPLEGASSSQEGDEMHDWLDYTFRSGKRRRDEGEEEEDEGEEDEW